MDMKSHWERVYAGKKPDEVSWYQANPGFSLRMIESAELNPADPVIDVGGGASRLADCLVELGYADLTVLDISGTALEHARQRLGDSGRKIKWIESDVTEFDPPRRYRFWHDRAVFHFLVNSVDRARYLAVMNRSVSASGYVMIAAFAPDGPEKCSGLPVERYSHESLARTLGPDFQMILKDREAHATPWGDTQNFIYALFKKNR